MPALTVLSFLPYQAGLTNQIQGHLHSSHHGEHCVSPAPPQQSQPCQFSLPPHFPSLPPAERASAPASLSCTGCPHRLFAWGSIWPRQILLL